MKTSARRIRGAVSDRAQLAGWALVCLAAAGGWILLAQEEKPRRESLFTMGRIRFTTPNFGWMGGSRRMGGGPPWSHDWPRGEEHLMKIMGEVTRLDVNPGGHIVSFDAKDAFHYPIAYMCEVGFLDLTDEEAHNMGEYLLRGGFLIVDDFRGDRDLDNFKRQLKKVFPDRSLAEVPRTHPIWTCFYDITKVFPQPPYARNLLPQYLGMSDDRGRLMMIVNYNNDISEYWEWSGNPWMPIDQSNEAYKYGVNYIMYALTH
jgi:hypothetical protein